MRRRIEKPLLIAAADENGEFVEIASWLPDHPDSFGSRSKFRIIISRETQHKLLNNDLRLGPISATPVKENSGREYWVSLDFQPGKTLSVCKPASDLYSMHIKYRERCDRFGSSGLVRANPTQ
jgi:hypothetical protein